MGYYATKHFLTCPKADGYITIGDPYTKKAKVPDSRIRGKQFVNNAHFTAYKPQKYQGTPYNDTLGYLKAQPLDSRKNGFGSKDAHKRDEFLSALRTEQYRETLKVRKTPHPPTHTFCTRSPTHPRRAQRSPSTTEQSTHTS